MASMSAIIRGTVFVLGMAVASGPAGPVLAGPVFAIEYTFSGLRMRKSIRLRIDNNYVTVRSRLLIYGLRT